MYNFMPKVAFYTAVEEVYISLSQRSTKCSCSNTTSDFWSLGCPHSVIWCHHPCIVYSWKRILYPPMWIFNKPKVSLLWFYGKKGNPSELGTVSLKHQKRGVFVFHKHGPQVMRSEQKTCETCCSSATVSKNIHVYNQCNIMVSQICNHITIIDWKQTSWC